MLSGKRKEIVQVLEWYWIGIGLGLFAPWVMVGGDLYQAFRERTLIEGLGMWSGMCVITVPVMLLVTWIADYVGHVMK